MPAPKTPVASRADLQFVSAFIAGSLAPFAGGIIATLAASLIWGGISGDYYSDQLGFLVNSVIFSIFALGYLSCFFLFVFLMAKASHRSVPLMITTRALLPVALCAVASIAISYQLASLQPTASVLSDALSIVIFGSGYVLGWWVVRRYAKL